MTLFKKTAILFSLGALAVSSVAFAFEPKETARYFNGPTVSGETSTSATFSLSSSVLAGMTNEEKSRVYFEYIEKDLMCIAIYPTPAACLPKKTEVGKTPVEVKDLKPNTTYTVKYKADNTIMCITAPCPGNEFESLTTEFKTQTTVTPPPQTVITKNLFIGSRGVQVTLLQEFLISKGYMRGTAIGYFGFVTFQAVRQFQGAHIIPSTGFVGVLTRKAIADYNSDASVGAEKFEGTITAYSTQCFVDGECSITVDGKKVVTTTGWSQMTVGTVTGIPDFGSIADKVGSRVKVYAKKTATGYTLYGSTDYYVQVQ